MTTRRERGFTLVELMVVIVILGSLIAIVGPNVWRALFQSQEDTAEFQMSQIANAISMYKLDNNGKVPDTLSELTQVDERSGEPYIETIPNDPWGGQYEYKKLSRTSFRINSAGADGMIGNEDDLVFPKDRDDD